MKSLGRCNFKSPKCKCWNLSQLSLQGGILGRFLLGFSQCNSRVSDWIPARCFEAPLSPQNGFSSLLEPSLRLTWFLLKLLTYSAIKSHKKNLIWSQSGPRIGTKNRTQNWGQNWDQNWNPNWAQNWDQKGSQNWKTHFGLVLNPFLEPISGPVLGPNLGRFTRNFVFQANIEITGNKGFCKGADKADETQLEDNSRTAPTIFSTAARLSNYLWKTFLQTPRLCLPCSCRFEPSQRTPAKQRCYLN